MSEMVRLRITLAQASTMVMKLWLVVAAVLVFQIVRRSGEPPELGFVLIGVASFATLFAATAWVLREAYRITLVPTGISMGWSKSVDWSEILQVAREKVPLAGTNNIVRSKHQSTIVVLDSIAARTEFRQALEEWAPDDHPLRSALQDSQPDQPP